MPAPQLPRADDFESAYTPEQLDAIGSPGLALGTVRTRLCEAIAHHLPGDWRLQQYPPGPSMLVGPDRQRIEVDLGQGHNAWRLSFRGTGVAAAYVHGEFTATAAAARAPAAIARHLERQLLPDYEAAIATFERDRALAHQRAEDTLPRLGHNWRVVPGPTSVRLEQVTSGWEFSHVSFEFDGTVTAHLYRCSPALANSLIHALADQGRQTAPNGHAETASEPFPEFSPGERLVYRLPDAFAGAVVIDAETGRDGTFVIARVDAASGLVLIERRSKHPNHALKVVSLPQLSVERFASDWAQIERFLDRTSTAAASSRKE